MNKVILKLFAFSILFASHSVYAACIIDGTSYNVGGTGLTSSTASGGAITLAIIRDNWDTSGDDVSTCDTSNINDMTDMFKGEQSFNQNISTWDTSNVTSFHGMFERAVAFNQPIGSWSTGEAINSEYMFFHAEAFNQPIGTWDMAKSATMNAMFRGAVVFNQDIGDWDTGAVTGGINASVEDMFHSATAFNQDISDWDTSKMGSFRYMFYEADNFNNGGVALDWSDTSSVVRMDHMFHSANAFNQAISSWNTSNVTDFISMFESNTTFNQDVSPWNTSSSVHLRDMFRNATDFNNGGVALDWAQTSNWDSVYSMFEGATAFNQNVCSFDMNGSTTFQHMFYGATDFNQDVSCWDVSTVNTVSKMFAVATDFNNGGLALDWSDTGEFTTIDEMFEGASAFNQAVSTWDTSEVTNMDETFRGATAFNQSISAWDLSSVSSNTDMFTGATAYNALVPTLSSSNPRDGQTDFSPTQNIILTFTKAVDRESGNIVIKKTSDNSTVETIAVTDSKITGTGTTQITINPATTLILSTGYYLNIAATAFDDPSSNSYAGISDATTLNFTIENLTLSSSSPSDGATGVALDANIVLNFNVAVDVESGNIVIKKTSDNSTVETIAVGNSKITGTGTTQITINPATTFALSTGYYLTIAATAFDDANGISYAGITDATTLNFMTNLPTPLAKKDVIGSIEAWSDISSRWVNSSTDNAFNRIEWLDRRQGSKQTSHQGIKISFLDTLIDKIMNNIPTSAFRDIDAVETSASIINNSDGTLTEVSDNLDQELTDIAINEAAILRESLVGSLNPSFDPVIDNWSVWTEGKIIIGKTDASTTSSKKEFDIQAFSVGIDKPVGDNELMGFVLSFGQDDTDIGTASTKVESGNFSVANYNVFTASSDFKIESVFGLGRIGFDSVRTDGSDTLTGTRKATQLFFSGALKPIDSINFGNWQVSPFGKVSLANTNLKGFSESGANTALTFDKQDIKDTSFGIGVDINNKIVSDDRTIEPYAKIELNKSSSKSTASMHYNSETLIYTSSLNKKYTNLKLKFGLDFKIKSGWDLSVSYMNEQSIGSSKSSKNSNSFSLSAGTRF